MDTLFKREMLYTYDIALALCPPNNFNTTTEQHASFSNDWQAAMYQCLYENLWEYCYQIW